MRYRQKLKKEDEAILSSKYSFNSSLKINISKAKITRQTKHFFCNLALFDDRFVGFTEENNRIFSSFMLESEDEEAASSLQRS